MLKKVIDYIKSIPWYGWVFAVATWIIQVGFYHTTNRINITTGMINNAFAPKIPWLDDQIAVVPMSGIPYLISYAFWVMGALQVSRTNKENMVNVSIGYFIALLVGLICFVTLPTTLDRKAEGLIDLANSNVPGASVIRTIYSCDGGDRGYNLLPSYHCLISLYWCLAVHFQKNISRGYKLFSIMAVVIICFSTVTTKQHYVVDVFAGIGVSLVVFFLIKLINPYKLGHKLKLKIKGN